MARENIIFIGSDALLQATEITDVESGDAINTAVITASIFGEEIRYPVSILEFWSGGALPIAEGDVITGTVGGATAFVQKISLTSGNWLAGSACGQLELIGQDGTFQAENLDTTTQANIGTIVGDSTTLEAVLLGNGKIKVPMNTVGLDAMGFIHIESSKKYNGQYDIEAIDAGGATQEIQTSTLDALMTAGTFTITYKGETTAAIAFNATVAQITTALELLSTVDVGDITMEAAHEPDTTLTCTWTFLAALGNPPMLSIDITAATGPTYCTWDETVKGGTAGYVTITAANYSEIFTGNERIYIGILNGKDIAFAHDPVGPPPDADGYYDGLQPSDLEGIYEGGIYHIIETITYGGHTVLHKYDWDAGYYSNLQTG